MVGFTLLVVPPSNTNPRVIAAFPALDGLIPWAETSVAVEHFALDSGSEIGGNQLRSSSFSTPLMEISPLPDSGLRKSKHTVATLNVAVEEVKLGGINADDVVGERCSKRYLVIVFFFIFYSDL